MSVGARTTSSSSAIDLIHTAVHDPATVTRNV